jgi:hypothetical protein
MALPSHVRPRDIISSDLINAILDQLGQLTGGPTGSVVVPNVFGTFLGDARTIILQPFRQLTLGFTLDVTGAAIDPASSVNFNLIVLNQSPQGDALVPPNTPVNLIVSQAGTSTTPPVTQPTFDDTRTPGGASSTSFPVNGPLVIVGTNFSANASQNAVTFNGIPAASVTSDPADPTRRLGVVVPAGIPGAPDEPGEPPLAGVVINVQKTGAQPVTRTVTVMAPVPGQPRIDVVSPQTQFELQDIEISGANFTPSAQVLIRDQLAAIVGTPTAGKIFAKVPDFPDIIPGPPVPASLVVRIPGVGEALFSGTFRVRGI